MVFVVAAERADAPTRGTENLLEPRPLFGMQPWTLAASDFARGTAKSIGGEYRKVKAARLGATVVIDVRRAVVSWKNDVPTRSTPGGYGFDAITVRVDARAYSRSRT